MNSPNEFADMPLAHELRRFEPECAIVLGSGLNAFAGELAIEHEIGFEEITGLPVAHVPGHANRFLFAEIAGRKVVIAQGRVHLYEGHGARDVAAGVRFMASLGISKIILTNAAGALNPAFAPGAWMMLSDHINLTGATPLLGGANFFDMSEVYCERLRMGFAKAAQNEGVALHEGVYAGVLGPQYETPAEIHMLRIIGADAVGMSTVIEAIQARALGLEIAGFSCLTNWAAGLGKKLLSHEEVLETATAASADFARLLRRVLADFPLA
jgi:purine-nucleoside phosphorylase